MRYHVLSKKRVCFILKKTSLVVPIGKVRCIQGSLCPIKVSFHSEKETGPCRMYCLKTSMRSSCGGIHLQR